MWLELSVSADLAAVEAISALFHQHGEGGVAIDHPFYTDLEGEHYGIDTARQATVLTYVPDSAEGAQRQRRIEEGLWRLSAFDLAPIGELAVRKIAEEDWAHAWKEHYHPLYFGRLVIKPTWREVAATPGQLVVEIDPGMAFGTGIHQTTRMCLAALERLVQPGWTVLDQGAGSGILAVTAARLGARMVLARDIAEVAIDACRENAVRNGLVDQLRIERVNQHAEPRDQVLLSSDQPIAHLVVANIIANTIIRLAPFFRMASHPGALLITSGIIRDRADETQAALQDVGYVVEERIVEDEWVTMIARLVVPASIVSS